MRLRNFSEALNFGLCSVAVKDDLPQWLTCNLCSFTTPKLTVLSCGHIFCQTCVKLDTKMTKVQCGLCVRASVPIRVTVDEACLLVRMVMCGCGMEISLGNLKGHCGSCEKSAVVFKKTHEGEVAAENGAAAGSQSAPAKSEQTLVLRQSIDRLQEDLRLFKKTVRDEVRLLAAKLASEVEPQLAENLRRCDEATSKVEELSGNLATVQARDVEALLEAQLAEVRQTMHTSSERVTTLETTIAEHTQMLQRHQQGILLVHELPNLFTELRDSTDDIRRSFNDHLQNEGNMLTNLRNDIVGELGDIRFFCYISNVTKKYGEWRNANFSKMDFFSDSFHLEGYNFRLNISFTMENTRAFLGIFIKPLPPTHSTRYPRWPLRRQFRLSIHSHLDPAARISQDFNTVTDEGEVKAPFVFPNGESWGFKNFCSLQQAMSPESGYLHRDSFLVSVEIITQP